MSDDELRFLGWVLTDGYRNATNNAVAISQSAASPHLSDIEHALKGCGFGYRTYRCKRTGKLACYAPGILFVVPYGQPRGTNRGLRGWKDLADYLNHPLLETLIDISRRQLRVLLEAMNLGDGNKYKPPNWTKRTRDICLGEHKFLVDQMQALLVLRGFRCNIAIDWQETEWHSRAPQAKYILHVREQQAATIGGSKSRGNTLVPKRSRFARVPFDTSEMVWCLQTEYGTLVTRRRGKVCVVGNCGRGFRISPGKRNCLVLDFGGNLVRHGPVDQVRLQTRSGDGNGLAPAKECPECRSVIAAGYAHCPDCGFAFPPPARSSHDSQASEAGVLTGQVTLTKYRVSEVYHTVHTKSGAQERDPQTMRVDYKVGWHEYKSEWVCLEHRGYARQKAVAWWQRRSPDPVPDTAERAVALAQDGALVPTLSITVRAVAGEPYERIVDYELGTMPEPVPADVLESGEEALDPIPF